MPYTYVPASSSVEPLWHARQLAQRLGIHRTHLYLLVRTGRIPHLRIGRALRFDPNAIRAWERSGGWVTPNLKHRAGPDEQQSGGPRTQ